MRNDLPPSHSITSQQRRVSRLRRTILPSRAACGRLRRRRVGGFASTLSALGVGLAPLLGNLFGFLLFFHPELLDPFLRRSLLEFDAIAPCALKRLEWSGHFYTGTSPAILCPALATSLNRTGVPWRRDPLPGRRRRHVNRSSRDGGRLRDLRRGGRWIGGAWVANI